MPAVQRWDSKPHIKRGQQKFQPNIFETYPQVLLSPLLSLVLDDIIKHTGFYGLHLFYGALSIFQGITKSAVRVKWEKGVECITEGNVLGTVFSSHHKLIKFTILHP